MKISKKTLLNLFKSPTFLIAFLLVAGFIIRFYVIQSKSFPFDYDQYEDLFLTKRIVVDHDPVLIGRPIYGDPNLHHGVVFFYFNIIPFILFNWSPLGAALWNSLFNVCVAVIIFRLSLSLFNNKLAALISAAVIIVSYEMVQFSTWISSTTITIWTVPLVFWGAWNYIKKKKWGLYVASLFLGLSIQAEIFFVYLIPILFVIYLVFRPRLPDVKTFIKAFAVFVLSISTLIYTELKLDFAGIKTLLSFSNTFDDSKISIFNRLEYFIVDLFKTISFNLMPHKLEWSLYLGIGITLYAILLLLTNFKKNKKEFDAELFVLIYFLSPVVMIAFGYHRQPWFLIGMIPSVALLVGYLVSKQKYLIIPFIAILLYSNLIKISEVSKNGMGIFFTEESSTLSSQVAVMDYVYQVSRGEKFAINAVSYPLYHNAIWEYNFKWYGENRYGYLPTWSGGDQVYPYKVLNSSLENEKYKFMIMDTTVRVPEIYRQNARKWFNEQGDVVTEKEIDGFIVLGIIQE